MAKSSLADLQRAAADAYEAWAQAQAKVDGALAGAPEPDEPEGPKAAPEAPAEG